MHDVEWGKDEIQTAEDLKMIRNKIEEPEYSQKNQILKHGEAKNTQHHTSK